MAIRGLSAGLVAVAAASLVVGCNREAKVDRADIDRGAARVSTPLQPAPTQESVTLHSGAQVNATPTAAALKSYLDSSEPTGRRFSVPSISFVNGMELREDPDGSVASLAAIMNAHPKARFRIEVAKANPGVSAPSPDAANRAEEVGKLFIRNGVDPRQIETAGVLAGPSDAPRIDLTVIAK